MYKAKPLYHAGREYIQISKLPAVQSDFLNRHIFVERKITLIINGENLEDCITYSDYELWFQLINLSNYEHYVESQI